MSFSPQVALGHGLFHSSRNLTNTIFTFINSLHLYCIVGHYYHYLTLPVIIKIYGLERAVLKEEEMESLIDKTVF